jgi:hypothetical protein
MIKHIVLWKLKDTVDGKTKNETGAILKSALESLQGKIRELQAIEVGLNFNPAETASDISLYSEFNSKEDLDRYQKHPEHLKVALLVKQYTSERRVSDYEVDHVR